ncbi:hypothetical protein N7540_000234 [Penicillium herquei]|nr:hypothetical protein N7540_000234 [Penicillium herquei]
MAAAAVFDPAAPDETGISLFYNTDKGQLAVSLKNATDGPDPDKTFAASEDDYHGHITSPSELASGSFRGFNIVVAVTVPNSVEDPKTTNQISVVSPVYLGIGSNSFANKKVVITTSETNAWVYFLDGVENSVVLKEFKYTIRSTTSHPADGDISLNSSLGGWYDPASDDRFVIYQDSTNGSLKQYNLVDKGTGGIVSTSDAKNGTSIAVTYAQGTVYLYYADSTDTVRRVTKVNGQWGSSTVVRDAPPLGNGQLTVVTANGFNHIFYIARDDSIASRGFTHIVERI